MEKCGHAVTLVRNGREALEAYRSHAFDIVLMDVQMPVMDGISATAEIRIVEAQERGVHVPIIGLTAQALNADRIRCLKAGMDGYLPKPFKIDELVSLVEELTNRVSW
jgi:CheY-like chemotaxis protein